jgi:hypothetical protein
LKCGRTSQTQDQTQQLAHPVVNIGRATDQRERRKWRSRSDLIKTHALSCSRHGQRQTLFRGLGTDAETKHLGCPVPEICERSRSWKGSAILGKREICERSRSWKGSDISDLERMLKRNILGWWHCCDVQSGGRCGRRSCNREQQVFLLRI